MSEEVNMETDSFNQDFTTATRWEVFCARLEEIIHDWKLPYKKQGATKLPLNSLSTNEWETKEELVTFDGMELKVTLHMVMLALDSDKLEDQSPDSIRRMSVDVAEKSIHDKTSKILSDSVNQECQAFVDLMSLENNFCTLDEKSNLNIHPLARWYGLRQFIVIATVGGATISENQRRTLLSSVHMAIGETNITIPIFVQALKFPQHVYSGTFHSIKNIIGSILLNVDLFHFAGVCEHENTRISFDIVHLAHTHPSCKFLSGILDMFKEKVPYEYKDPVTVSVRYTIILKHFTDTSFVLKRKFAFADRSDDAIDEIVYSNRVLPFGVSVDPVRELVLYCKWPEYAENVVMDSRNYTDFDPMLSQYWSFRMHYEAIPNTFMRECLYEFLQQCDSMRSLAELIGAEYAYSATSDVTCRDDSNPLERLTVSKITKITSSVFGAQIVQTKKSTSKKGKPMEGPLKDEQLMAMLYFLFPDAQENTPNSYKIPTIDNVNGFYLSSAFDQWI